MYVCMYVCIYIYIYVYISICAHLLSPPASISVRLPLRALRPPLITYITIYNMCIHVCVYIYIYK